MKISIHESPLVIPTRHLRKCVYPSLKYKFPPCREQSQQIRILRIEGNSFRYIEELTLGGDKVWTRTGTTISLYAVWRRSYQYTDRLQSSVELSYVC